MNAPNAFDDLARRKLAERDHPFDEAAWEALRPELDAMRADRRRRRFLLWFMLLIGAGIAGWLLIPDAPRPDLEGVRKTSTTPIAKAAEAPVDDASTSAPEGTSTSSTPHASTTPETHRPETGGTSTTKASHRITHAPTKRTRAEATNDQATPRIDIGHTGTTPQLPATTPSTPITQSSDQPSVSDRGGPAFTAAPSAITDSIGSLKNDSAMVPATVPHINTDLSSAPPIPIEPDTSGTVADASRDTMRYEGLTDTLSISTTTPPKDTPPALPVRKLELSAWAGPFLTRTHYSGERTKDWASIVDGGRTVMFGAELMRQGEHFGLGLGLHYTTYAERIEAQSLKDEFRSTVTNYHLQSIDTTLMIVNGSVWINGQQYYVTHMLDTTLHVLVGTEREVVSTTVRRNALTRSNRTNYLEIPLLFDAHLRRGTWSFALRGGPALGILQGRRGSLPTTSGYTELGEEAFSELVLGYTLQGHVRYHLGDLWSVGVGPAFRGQLTNSFQGEELHRRASAAGAVISVGYRLP